MDRRRWLTLGIALVTTTAVQGEWRRDNRDACARLDQRLKDIGKQRRAGYTPKQGRTLTAKREDLEQQRREQCR